EIAKKVGKAQYQKYLKQFQYGNQDISGGIDRFWLGSSLQISANEQVEFLKKFYSDKLSVSNRTTELVKDISFLEKNNDYKLSGKTGCASPANNCNTLSWFVGFLEKADNVYFFATNLEGNGQEVSSKKRIALTKQALAKLGIL
ncbi:MAG TPA: class D beta-lactamase, partial [Cyanobacteria bacterium UBA11049]|nr:class D beta-lactamase [Cyanobacteria bacterium UBA11049]